MWPSLHSAAVKALRTLGVGVVALAAVVGACSGTSNDVVAPAALPTAAPAVISEPPVTTLPPVTLIVTVAPTTPPATAAPPPSPPPTIQLPAPTTASPATTTTLPPSPLNGLGVTDEELLDRRVMAVKIDNHRNARPQSGLQEAEAVYELLVEGGLSRFIALFHAVDSSYVGPIRSIRPTDPTLLKPLGAPMQISGGQAWVRSLVARLDVNFMGEVSGDATFRISSRSAPHNLFGDTAEMRVRADRLDFSDAPPAPIFVFGDASQHTGEAYRIRLSWSGGNDVYWEYDGDRYLRFQGDVAHEWVDEDGDGGQVAFDTLVVLVAERYTARPRSSESGSSVPALDTVGEGEALLFYGGLVVEGSWSRTSIDEPFLLETATGDALVVPPGRLWISVFPHNRTVSWE